MNVKNPTKSHTKIVTHSAKVAFRSKRIKFSKQETNKRQFTYFWIQAVVQQIGGTIVPFIIKE